MNNLTNFYKQTIALLTGDKDQAVALKNERRAMAQLRNQVSALELEISKQEDLVEQAQDAYHNAKYPAKLIEDGSRYLTNISTAYGNLQEAEKNLKKHQESLVFWQNLMSEFEKSSEA